VKSYTIKDNSAQVDMDAQIQLALGSSTSTIPLPLHLTLVQEAGSWKIDVIQSSPALTS
jgi:hypothetical protein